MALRPLKRNCRGVSRRTQIAHTPPAYRNISDSSFDDEHEFGVHNELTLVVDCRSRQSIIGLFTFAISAPGLTSVPMHQIPHYYLS